MISINNITFGYPDQEEIFKEFSWDLQAGERWAVLGPSGCGKSTFLYLLAGLLFPSHGEINIHKKLLERPRPQTGLIIQDYGLLPWATVKDNASLGLKIRTFYGPDGTHAPLNANQNYDLDYWLERLGLLPHINKYPSQLSGGQRQRTAIARTLSLKPDLILMDEPFSSLDAPTRESLQELTLELHKEGDLSMVVVTHSIEEAAIIGSKILVLTNPPNTNPQIVPNPHSTSGYFRRSSEFQDICERLRHLLDLKYNG